MGILEALGIIGAFLSIGFGITKWASDKEEQSKLEEKGLDSASLAQKQIDLSTDNLALNKDVAEKNYNLQQEQFNYQKQLNDTLMQREDTAYQRQVADLKAAGFSPLMIAGGSPATALQSAPAPQRDMSGINSALQNMLGAYNDVFNRRMNEKNFALQNKVQTAQMYSQLAESYLNMKKTRMESDILSLDYEYYKNHPERNLGLQQVLLNLASNFLRGNKGGLPDVTLPAPTSGNSNNGLFDLLQSDTNTSSPRIAYPTQKQIKKDTNKLLSEDERKYNQFASSIENVKDFSSESFNNAVSYFWNYYGKYDKGFNSFDSFKSKLINDKNYRSKIRSNFKYKAPFSPW